MIAEDRRETAQDRGSAVAVRCALEQRIGLRRVLRGSVAQVEAVVRGGRQPIRPMVVAVRDLFSRHLAESAVPFGASGTGGLQTQIAEALAELEALCAWPEEEDDLELALRFQALATALLDAMAAVEPLGC